jgi:hypothetical protein
MGSGRVSETLGWHEIVDKTVASLPQSQLSI